MKEHPAGARKVLVFGAGPAGMTAAISAARSGARVTLVEKTDEIGRKLSMTGNGRANLSNRNLTHEMYHTEAAGRMDGFLSRFGTSELISFLSSIGLLTRWEGDGLYPVSGQASAAVLALRRSCERSGVEMITGAQLKTVTPKPAGGFVCGAGGREFSADAVILATGGLSGPRSCQASGDAYYLCEQLGIPCTPRYPALVPLIVEDETLPQKTGVRAWARIRFFAERDRDRKPIADEFGEVQFTAKSVSGIPVLQASDIVARALHDGFDVRAEVDLFPEVTETAWQDLTADLTGRFSSETVLNVLCGICNASLAESILRRLSLTETDRMSDLSPDLRNALFKQLRAFPVRIRGIGDYARAQATAGGASLAELDDDCQSRRIPGLYLAGELVDVNGRCGGYNLHWAFLSGMLSGVHAARGRSFEPDDAEG